jgi:hypothetical protein
MDIVVNRTGFDVKLSPVLQPIIYRLSAYNYKIIRQDTEENLPNHYVDVYVDGNYIMETQQESINLKNLVAPLNRNPIEIKFVSKRIVTSTTLYAEPYLFYDRNMVVRHDLLCDNTSIIQE